MMNSSERRRQYRGPVFFSHGFRSFFLYSGIWAALAMLVWVIFLATGTGIPSRMAGVDWHMHEMLFGYSSAVIAGFLLTAVPNWTGRMPIIGWPTAMLSGLWLLGRVAVFFSAWLPEYVAAVIDASFLVVFAGVISREVVSGKNWRNLKVMVFVILLAIANIVYHIEAAQGSAYEGYGVRMGVGFLLMLIIVIGGRVIPSFTRNWMMRNGGGRLPVPFNNFDKVTLVLTGATLLWWMAWPTGDLLRTVMIGVGLLHFVRLWRWAGWGGRSEPLVLILHVGYFFVPLGFVMLGLGDLLPGWTEGRIPHAWMVGAVGVTTIAMMTRASLGHSGRPLVATKGIAGIYVLLVSTVFLRMAAEMLPSETWLLHLTATTWIAAYGLFAIVYFPILTKPRI